MTTIYGRRGFATRQTVDATIDIYQATTDGGLAKIGNVPSFDIAYRIIDAAADAGLVKAREEIAKYEKNEVGQLGGASASPLHNPAHTSKQGAAQSTGLQPSR